LRNEHAEWRYRRIVADLFHRSVPNAILHLSNNHPNPMNSEYLRQLLDFHYWARDRVFRAVEALTPEQYARPMGNSFASIRDTLNHIYLAEWIWYSRWNGVSPTEYPNFELSDLVTLRARWTEMERNVRTYFASAGDNGLDRVIEYRLMSGKESAAPLWQMMAHVVNHATYHRGQITTLLRQLGAAPAQSTDMITFFREQAATTA
jgi:uncharacterized damage-inducible protein DinB